jgi:hypothetical protein
VRGTILATRDGGATWTPQVSGTDRGLYGVHFADPKIGWAVGDSIILVTRDGGSSWTPQGSGTDQTLLDVHFAGREAGWAVGSDGIILATRDGGTTWTQETSGTDQDLESVHFAGRETGWAVGVGGTILAIRDGGASWTLQASGTDRHLTGVRFTGPEAGWAVGLGGTILATRDGGQSWQPLENYRRHPAPWVYLAWICAFGCLLAAARKVPADLERAPQSVADRLASDRPLEASDPDPLGYQRIAAGLSRFLRNEKTEPPLTVAVTGDWRSGKSSLMNLLRADLERYDFRPVWFNAWHHQKEEHLFAALLEAVRGQAVPGWWSYAGLVFRWRLLRKRTRAHLFWTVLVLTLLGASLGLTVAKWPQITAHLGEWVRALPASVMLWPSGGAVPAGDAEAGLGEWLGSLLAPLTPIITLLTALLGAWATLRNRLASWQLSPAKLLASARERSGVRALDAQLGFRHEFALAFREVCEALHPRTLTIIIDDLDRCRPEQVVETLEAVNFLVTAGPCYVILGIAPEQVMRCIGLGFKDLAAEVAAAIASTNDGGRASRREFAKHYLEKLINVEVPVPTLTSEDARKIVAAGSETERPRILEKQGSRPWMAACFAFLFLGALYVGANVDAWLRPPDIASVPKSETIAAPTSVALGSEATSSGGEATEQTGEWPDRVFFREGKQAEAPWWSWLVPLAGLGGLGGLVLLIHALRREDPVVRDSKDFREALDIWVPVVLARTRSPRAVKRFVNRVRYYAMCEARPEPTPTWNERLAGLFRRGRESRPIPSAPRLPETMLVALAAIHQWKPEALSASNGAELAELLNLRPDPADNEIVSALGTHSQTFGQLEPGESAIKRFREIAAGVTVR